MSKTLSPFSGALIMVTTMFGAGILFLPAAVKPIGWLPFSALFAITTFFIGLTMYFLCGCALYRRKDTVTYFEVLQDTYPIFGPVIDAFIAFLGVAAALVYVGVITSTICSLFSLDEIRVPVLLGVTIIAFALSISRDISSLAPASYLSLFCVISLSSFLVFNFFINKQNCETHLVNKTDFDFGKSFGKVIFAMACQNQMCSVYSQLADNSAANILKVILLTCFIGPSLYYAVAMFGYLGLGEEANGSVIEILANPSLEITKNLLDYSQKVSYASKIVTFLFTVSMVCSCAFQMNPAKISFASLMEKCGLMSKSTAHSMKYHVIITFCCFAAIFALNALKLRLEIVLNLIGAVGCNFVCFIFPAVAFLGTVKKSSLRAFAVITILLGVVTMIYSLYLEIRGLIPS